jgi:hypothetical protein
MEIGITYSKGEGEKYKQNFGRIKPEGKRSFRRPRFRWKDSIKVDHKDI